VLWDDFDFGEQSTWWSVRAAVLLYVLTLAIRLRSGEIGVWRPKSGESASAGDHAVAPGSGFPIRNQNLANLCWTFGFAAIVIHVLCAFHFFHDWSHDLAYQATAQETAQVVGLDWGGGVYFNYLFVLVWGADVAWCWLRPAGVVPRPIISVLVQVYLGFIMFNAVVIFETGWLRWSGLGACLVLWILWRSRTAHQA